MGGTHYTEGLAWQEDHFLGTGAYGANTPEQAAQLYAELPHGSRAEADALAAARPGADVPGSEAPGGEYDERRPPPHAFQPHWFRSNMCTYPNCVSPRRDHEDPEDLRGPDGPDMPQLDDLPNYTILGQLLRRFNS